MPSCLPKTISGVNSIDVDVDINSNLEVDSLEVINNATVDGDLSVGGNIIVTGTFDITGNLTLENLQVNQTSTTDGVATFNDDVNVTTGTTSVQDLTVATGIDITSGSTTFQGPILIGNSTTSGNESNDVIIGKNSTSTTGARSVGVGFQNSVGGQDVVVVGNNNTTTFTKAGIFGTDNTNTGSTNAFIFGNNNVISGTSTNSFIIGNGITVAGMANRFVLLNNTYSAQMFDSLFFGSGDFVFSNTQGPFVSSAGFYTNNASTYTMTPEEVVNGKLRNTYGTGAATLTWPSYASIISFLENYVGNTPVGDTLTRHTMFRTTIMNTTAQTIAFTAGTNQTAVGTTLSSGLNALEVAVYESYLTASGYSTVRVSLTTL